MSRKIKVTWSKAATLFVSTLLFGLLMKGNEAVSSTHDTIFYITQSSLMVAMIASVINILVSRESEEKAK